MIATSMDTFSTARTKNPETIGKDILKLFPIFGVNLTDIYKFIRFRRKYNTQRMRFCFKNRFLCMFN